MTTQSSILQNKSRTEKQTLSVSDWISGLLELAKIKITVFVAFTTALGYILASGSLSLQMLFPVAGIFLLACSSAMVNQIQEWRYDSLMNRTMNRPIPAMKFSLTQSWIPAVFTFAVAVLILYFGSNLLALSTALLTFVWYNLIYTPLKRKTSLAIIPGSMVGALPPLAGWFAAGGVIADVNIWIIFAYFFIWQIPHFWLLLLIYKDDYKAASFPVLTDKVSTPLLEKMIVATTILTSAVAVYFVFAGEMSYSISQILIVVFAFMLSVNSFSILGKSDIRKKVFGSFIAINFFTLVFITILILDKLIKFIS